MSELSEAATRDRADTAFLVGCAHGRAMGAADVLAAKAEAWDEGYSYCFDDFGSDEVRSLNDNPYRETT